MLAFTDPMVTAVFGTSPPDLASLGYVRHTGEPGWWVAQVAFERQTTATAFTLVRRNAFGADAQIVYDPTGARPVRTVDELGNTMTATYDPRAMQIATIVDTSGATSTDVFDPLGRVIATAAGKRTPCSCRASPLPIS